LKKRKKENIVEEKNYNGATNYNIYKMSKKEWIMYVILAALFIFAIGYIFYKDTIIAIVLTPLSIKFPAIRTKDIIKKRKTQLTLQFKDMLYSLSSSIGSGSSVENSISYVLQDMIMQYGDEGCFIVEELKLMKQKLGLGMTVESVFEDFAERSGVVDIQTFSNIFEVANRTGGDIIKITRQTSSIISDKIEVKMEMDTMLSGKKMEQKVLTVIPIGLVYMLTVTTDGFMEPLFGSLIGKGVSTVALIIMAIGYFWSKKITDIQI